MGRTVDVLLEGRADPGLGRVQGVVQVCRQPAKSEPDARI